MIRLTKLDNDITKVKGTYMPYDERPIVTLSNALYVQCLLNKLGQLEDILQSYNVKDLEELNKLLEMATTYEELSKQLGCPLDFIFKVLKAPKIYIEGMNVRSEYDNSFKFHSRTNNYIINPYAIDGEKPEFLFVDRWGYGYDLRLKDYKKTWRLREDKSE